MNSRLSVIGDVARYVFSVRDGLHLCSNLGFGCWERPRPRLLTFRGPLHRKVSIEVESEFRGSRFDHDSVIVPDRPLRQQPVILLSSIVFIGSASHHKARLIRVFLPWTVSISDSHRENPAVLID